MEKIVLPGDELPEGVRYNPASVRKENGKAYATVVGAVENNYFVAYELAYVPHVGMPIVGLVYDKKPSAYFVDTTTAYTGLVLTREVRGSLDVGDIVSAKVQRIEGTDLILGYPRILRGGKLLKVPSSKVPRIIGKDASMVNMIKEMTGTSIFVGANGYVWIGGDNVDIAIKAIHHIIKRAHLHGLTDEIKALLIEENGKNPATQQTPTPEETESLENEVE